MARFLWLFIVLLAPLTHGRAQRYFARQYTLHDGLAQMQVMSVLESRHGFIWAGTKNGLSRFDGQQFRSWSGADGLPAFPIRAMTEDHEGRLWIGTASGLASFDGVSFRQETFFHNRQLNQLAVDTVRRRVVALDSDPKTLTRRSCLRENDGSWRDATAFFDQGYPDAGFIGVFYDPVEKGLFAAYADGQLMAWRDGGLEPAGRLPVDGRLSYLFAQVQHGQVVLGGEFSGGRQQAIEMLFFARKNGTYVHLGTTTDRKTFHPRSAPEADVYLIAGTRLFKYDVTGRQTVLLDNVSRPTFFQPLVTATGVWIGTEQGLWQFFGEGFREYSAAQLPLIWSMVEDARGRMWFGSYTDGFITLDGEKIERVPPPQPRLAKFQVAQPGATRDARGNLYLTTEAGIYRFDGRNFTKLCDSICLYVMYDDANRLLLAGVHHGLWVLSADGQGRFYGERDGLHPLYFVRSICKDPSGAYWLGGTDGVSRFDWATQKFRAYTRNNGHFPVACTNVPTLYTDRRGTVWAGTSAGLFRYDAGGDNFEAVAPDLIRTYVFNLAEAGEGHLLVGALDGLYFLNLDVFYRHDSVALKCFNQFNGYNGLEPGQNGAYRHSSGDVFIASSTNVVRIRPSALQLDEQPLRPYIVQINGHPLPQAGAPAVWSLPWGENTVEFTVAAIGFDRPAVTEYSVRLVGRDGDAAWSAWSPRPFAVFDRLGSGRYVFDVRARNGGNAAGGAPLVAHLPLRIDLPLWREPGIGWKLLTLTAGLALVTGLVFFRLQRARWQAQRRTYEGQLLRVETLQAQLHSHFLFNVLETFQQLVLQRRFERVDSFLQQLAQLIRRYLEASLRGVRAAGSRLEAEITLDEEVEMLRQFIEFERLQYAEAFEYTIDVAPGLDRHEESLPPMLIQPFVENAIKHGLDPSTGRRRIAITFYRQEERLIAVVRDYGPGQAAARHRKAAVAPGHRPSRGLELVENRVATLNSLGYRIAIRMQDAPGGGTEITIEIQ
jgi:ligand-binding sensor domain-containing protein/signal transduction histidine kinase